jgi:DTW domain-containing protein YfiP
MESSGFCTACLAPERRCICAFAKPVSNTLPVIILQHSNERNHAKGTGRLLVRSLENSKIITGQTFNEELQKIISDYSPALVFPERPTQDTRQALAKKSTINCLILIDATWKKALSIYLSHPQLHNLPKVVLSGYENKYHHRKSPSPGHLSTLEACCYALSQLQPDHQHRFKQLLINQEEMIRHQQVKAIHQMSHKQSSTLSKAAQEKTND